MNPSDHYYEAFYETWRSGYNPERINPDDSDNDYYDGRTPEFTANREIQHQRKEIEVKRNQEQTEQICYHCEVCCNCYGN